VVRVTIAQIRDRLGKRGIAAAAALFLVLIAVAATPQLLGTRVGQALHTVNTADPKWLWIAGLGFVISVAGAAGSWRSAISLCGGRLTPVDAAARFGVGSLVNTFVPARAGDAVRIGLFARALPNKERLWTTGGAFAALGAARAVVISGLVVAGAAAGAVPLWPLLIALGLVAIATATALKARNSTAATRKATHLLDAFRALGREPVAGIRLVGWIALGTLGRLASATAVGLALGIPHPLTAAFVIVPALEVAGFMPLTPGNVGVTSAAIAVAFQAHGVSFTLGLAAGIAFHAVETAVGLMFGIASVLWLAPFPTPTARRISLIAAGASWCLGIAGAFGATVLAPLV
jgi:uncharacterized membrane protein YbhN (UPF0104 family)